MDQLNDLLAPIANAALTLQRCIRGGAARATFRARLQAKVRPAVGVFVIFAFSMIIDRTMA